MNTTYCCTLRAMPPKATTAVNLSTRSFRARDGLIPNCCCCCCCCCCSCWRKNGWTRNPHSIFPGGPSNREQIHVIHVAAATQKRNNSAEIWDVSALMVAFSRTNPDHFDDWCKKACPMLSISRPNIFHMLEGKARPTSIAKRGATSAPQVFLEQRQA